jgi:uncharacterized protein
VTDAEILGAGDEPELLAYFDAHPDETIWLRCAHADGGARFAARRAGGRIVSVAAHDRIDAVHVHAAESLPELVQACVRPGASISAVAGPPEQVEAAIAALDLGGRAVARVSREIIMALACDELIPPPLLEREGVVVRRARPEDMPLLEQWLVSYFREIHSVKPDDAVLAEVRGYQAKGRIWVLEDGGAIVNAACFSAVFPRLVQIEYAYSPRELRSKHYGRSAVAGALLVARTEGIERAVFNTDEKNLAVQVGIQPIGFRTVARYHVVVFADQS